MGSAEDDAARMPEDDRSAVGPDTSATGAPGVPDPNAARVMPDATPVPQFAEASTGGAGAVGLPAHTSGPHPGWVPTPYPAGPWPPSVPEPAPKPTHRWGVGAYLLVEVVFLGSSVLLGLLIGGDGPLSAGALALALAVPTVLAASTALLITVVRGNGPRIDLGLHWTWRDVGIGLAYGFAGLVVTIPASILYVVIVGEETTSAVGEVFGDVRAGPLLAVTVFAIVVFLAPLCEEIVYRGLLWGGVQRLGAGPKLTLAITTLLFALAHFEFTRTPLLLIVALPIALARLRTGRLPASIVAHSVNNLLPGVALMLMLLGLVPAV